VRRLLGLLLLDAVALGIIGLAAWQFSASGVDRLVRAFAIHQGVARAAVAAIVAGVALPFILGLFRLTRATGQALALRALPAAEPGKVDLGLAPRRAFVVAWQLAGVFLIGVPLVAVARPVLGLPIGLLLLLVLLFALGFAFWRSATNLQGHTRAGAEVIVAALGRQLGPPTDMPTSEVIRPAGRSPIWTSGTPPVRAYWSSCVTPRRTSCPKARNVCMRGMSWHWPARATPLARP
jgi:CPA2 family monovalent cation:H+ antiporter-2